MLRYSILFFSVALLCASGCKNNQIIGDPFGHTRVPPPTTSGVVAAPNQVPYYTQPALSPTPATQPLMNQPPLAQPQLGQPPATTFPGNGLTPVPSTATPPTYPGTTPPPTYPQGPPLYPGNPGASLVPLPGSAVASTSTSTHTSANRVQPIKHQPRLRPVPKFDENTTAASRDNKDATTDSVVSIDEGFDGEPIIRIVEPVAEKKTAAPTARTPTRAQEEGVLEDSVLEGGSRDDDRRSQPTGGPQFRQPTAGAIAQTGHSSVLLKNDREPRLSTQPPIAVPADNSESRAPSVLSRGNADSDRIDVAELPQAVSKPKPKFRAMTSTPSARYGHADDYHWLKGKLEYSAARRQWKLRYIPLDGNADGDTDEYGGSVILDSVDESEYSSGEFVAVRGKLGERDPEVRDFSTTYRVQQMKSM